MEISFQKYEGAGNDFIMVDNREDRYSLNTKQIALICDRRFGVGGDGLILLDKKTDCDFRMVYYNSDGNESSFCGNGGRCIAHFAHFALEMAGKQMTFQATDGIHHAIIKNSHVVSLSMMPVKKILFEKDHTILDTGSPHYVKEVAGLKDYPVFKEGRRIRQLPEFMPKGINVNFLEIQNGKYHLRTYERGVEDETFACGTGVTATAIATIGKQTGKFSVPLITKMGHHFEVSFEKETPDTAHKIILTGPVHSAFKGNYFLED